MTEVVTPMTVRRKRKRRGGTDECGTLPEVRPVPINHISAHTHHSALADSAPTARLLLDGNVPEIQVGSACQSKQQRRNGEIRDVPTGMAHCRWMYIVEATAHIQSA